MAIDQRGAARSQRSNSGKISVQLIFLKPSEVDDVRTCRYIFIGSSNKRGNQMANKSYASSEMGDQSDANAGDPEFSKDFNSAYAKVPHLLSFLIAGREDLPRTRKHSFNIPG